MKNLLLLLVFTLLKCTKERSCEDCYQTQYKEYVFNYDILIDNNWELNYIEVQAKTKVTRDFILLDAISKVEPDSSFRYIGQVVIDSNSNVNLELLKGGDTILLRCACLWLSGNSTYLDYDTLLK